MKQLSKETLIENHKKNLIDLLITFVICAVGIIGSGWFLASERNNMIFWLLISLLLIVYLIFKTQKYFRLLQKLKQDQFIILQKGCFEKRKNQPDKAILPIIIIYTLIVANTVFFPIL